MSASAISPERSPASAGSGMANYKATVLRRRLAVRMRARGAADYAGVRPHCSTRDPQEYERLLDALTINVTKVYRNPETWDAVARRCCRCSGSLASRASSAGWPDARAARKRTPSRRSGTVRLHAAHAGRDPRRAALPRAHRGERYRSPEPRGGRARRLRPRRVRRNTGPAASPLLHVRARRPGIGRARAARADRLRAPRPAARPAAGRAERISSPAATSSSTSTARRRRR